MARIFVFLSFVVGLGLTVSCGGGGGPGFAWPPRTAQLYVTTQAGPIRVTDPIPCWGLFRYSSDNTIFGYYFSIRDLLGTGVLIVLDVVPIRVGLFLDQSVMWMYWGNPGFEETGGLNILAISGNQVAIDFASPNVQIVGSGATLLRDNQKCPDVFL